jgi:hypothetical protein
MAKFHQGVYTVENVAKYVGKHDPRYRSGWELMFFKYLDNNPAIIQWASEPITIPYRNPFTGKNTIYVPDILMIYQHKSGQRIAEVVEIKPSTQTNLTEARSIRDRASVALNHAKWHAANHWCQKNGMKFRVITEMDLFHQGKKR